MENKKYNYCAWIIVMHFAFIYKNEIIIFPVNGRYFADDILRYIFSNEKFCILIKI